MKPKRRFIPMTPAGTVLADCEASTEDGAWKNLMKAAAHMPYTGQAEFEKRGYTVGELMPVKTPAATRAHRCR